MHIERDIDKYLGSTERSMEFIMFLHVLQRRLEKFIGWLWSALRGCPLGGPFPFCTSICVELPFECFVIVLLWIEYVVGVVFYKKMYVYTYIYIERYTGIYTYIYIYICIY